MAWDNEKKKVKTAVAVAYEPGDKAPKILASGRGEVAEKIIAKAKENDVPFYKDNKLAETLSKLEIGDAIPPELYEVVAEILVFVDDMDKMKAKLQQAEMCIRDRDYPLLQSETDNYYLDYNLDHSKGYPGCIYTNQCNRKDFSDYKMCIRDSNGTK